MSNLKIVSTVLTNCGKTESRMHSISPLHTKTSTNTMINPLRPLMLSDRHIPPITAPQLLSNADHNNSNLFLSINTTSFPDSLPFPRVGNKTNSLYPVGKSSSSLLTFPVDTSSPSIGRPIVSTRNSQSASVWRPY